MLAKLKQKITFDRFGQLLFTFSQVTKLAAQISPGLLVLVLVLNAIWGLTAVPGFWLEKLVLDRLVAAIGNPDWQAVVRAIGFLVILRLSLEIIRNFLSSLTQFLRRTLSRRFDAELDLLMGKKLGELDLATIEDPDFKDKFFKIRQESGRRAWGLMMPLSDIPNYLLGFISAVAILLLIHPLVAVGVFIISLPQFFIDQKFIKRDYELNTALAPKHRLWGWLNYYLTWNKNYLELKILNLADFLAKKLRKTQQEIIGQWVEYDQKRSLARFWGLIPFGLFELGLSLWLVVWVVTQKITVGSFELYLRSLRSAQQNLTSLISSFLEVYENYIYVSDLIWFLDLKPQIELDSGNRVVSPKGFTIEFKNVWFRYKPDQDDILKDVNFAVAPGEKIAIVGENGAGKSTLIKLLARFYDPREGEILIGRTKLKDLNLRQWRTNLAILFQEFESYPFSVRETVGYGDVERIGQMADIKNAVAKTEMDEFVEDLPLKYKNPLDPEFEKGVKPSIGQWQRFGISRMLFRKNARVLIMDEPTSNVDPEAEEKIFQELVKVSAGKILIFVTQRFSTVRLADRILVVDGGRIIEKGTHQELMKKDGKYARLFNLQAKGYQ